MSIATNMKPFSSTYHWLSMPAFRIMLNVFGQTFENILAFGYLTKDIVYSKRRLVFKCHN